MLPTKPLGWMHGDAALRTLERRGAQVETGVRVDDVDDVAADAIVVATPPAESARLLGEPEPKLEPSPIVSVHLLFDRPLLRTPLAALARLGCALALRSGALTGIGPSKKAPVRDSGPEGSGEPGGSPWPADAQYLTVVSSGVPELMEVRGRELVERIAGQVTERLGHAELLWSRVSREPNATGRASPRDRGAAPRPADRASSRDARAARGPRPAGRRRWRAPWSPGRTAARLLSDVTTKGCCMTVVQELTSLDTAVELGAERLLSLQHPDGWWKGELESNATMTAQHLFLLHFLGLRDPETDRLLANELLAGRRDDGTWSIWFEGPPDLSVTVEAYAALKLAGVDAGEATRDYIRRAGGVPRARIFTRAFLALIGQWPWSRLAHVPVELILLPAQGRSRSTTSPAGRARRWCRCRSSRRCARCARSAIDLSEIGGRKTAPGGRPHHSARRRHAIRVAERWVRERQEADGSWGGIQPPWVWSLIMLAALGHGFEDETFARGLAGWERFMVRRGRPPATRGLPVADLGHRARRSSPCARRGSPADDPQLQAAGRGCSAKRSRSRGDWAIRRPGLAPGGWSFEFDNDLYPDVDDTAVVALALRELGLGDDAVRRGLDWLVGMQSRSGGWGAFDVDNEALWLYKLPICDFGKVTDEPSADVTAHALEALAHETGYGASADVRGSSGSSSEQEADGSWFGRWGVNHVYGTGAAVPALEACGVPPEHPAIRRALSWLDSVQQPSGAFGEDIALLLRARGPRAVAPRPLPKRPGRYSPTSRAVPKRACPRGMEPSIFARLSVGMATGTSAHFTGTGFPSIS